MLLYFMLLLTCINLGYILLGMQDTHVIKSHSAVLKYTYQITIIILILTSIIEEIIFRYCFWKLEKANNADYLIISSVLFSLYHMNDINIKNIASKTSLEGLYRYFYQYIAGIYLYSLHDFVLSCVAHTCCINLLMFIAAYVRYQNIQTSSGSL
jgi:membrane protease YdiL (CAAX protease family)